MFPRWNAVPDPPSPTQNRSFPAPMAATVVSVASMTPSTNSCLFVEPFQTPCIRTGVFSATLEPSFQELLLSQLLYTAPAWRAPSVQRPVLLFSVCRNDVG